MNGLKHRVVGEEEYCIGHVDNGIVMSKQAKLYELNEEEKESCKACVIRKRCNHYCGCMNKQATGSINKVYLCNAVMKEY